MNSMLGLAFGVCGLALIGYCVYFDNKRRSDPDFKKKLRERECVLPLKGFHPRFFLSLFDLDSPDFYRKFCFLTSLVNRGGGKSF